MLFDRNSNNLLGKKSHSSSITYIVMFLIIIALAFLSFKDKIKKHLQEFLEVPAHAESIKKEEIEKIVHDFINKNPQAIISSLQEMQKRDYEESLKQAKTNIKNKKDEIQGVNKEINPSAGNPNGDVTVVTFLDYRCGHCKKANQALKDLLKKDSNVKVIYKEYPILGEQSVNLAKTALAVYLIDPAKYVQFHDILMSSNDPSERFLTDTFKLMNIDPNKVKEMMQDPRISSELNSINKLCQEIGVRGTPAFIIGEELIPGGIDVNNMITLVNKTRADNKNNKK